MMVVSHMTDGYERADRCGVWEISADRLGDLGYRIALFSQAPSIPEEI
ncbi:MAG: hypothetical protein IJW45_03505 [Oscillospiraceae bacterium]|nr:hypothetical protein [Oscillospiraceae bacterium]